MQVANIDGIDINAANAMLSMMAGFNVLLVVAEIVFGWDVTSRK